MTNQNSANPKPEKLPSLSESGRQPGGSLGQQVVEELLDLIASTAGTEMVFPSERQLAEQLGVSRNVLREAFSALASLGVVTQRGKLRLGLPARARTVLLSRTRMETGGDGLVMNPVEARQVIEPEVAALAATRAPEAVIEEAARWQAALTDAVSRGERAVAFDSAFHAAIARGTGNHTLVEVIVSLTDALTETRELSFAPPGAPGGGVQEHDVILAALRARDADAARDAMQVHLANVAARVREATQGRRDSPE